MAILIAFCTFWQNLYQEFENRQFQQRFSVSVLLLTTVLGIATGISSIIGLKAYVLLALLGSGLPLGAMLAYPPIKQARLMAKYRQ
jgi:hypothetical protein